MAVGGGDCHTPSLPSFRERWPLPLLGATTPASGLRVHSYRVAVSGFLLLFSSCLLISCYVWGAAQVSTAPTEGPPGSSSSHLLSPPAQAGPRGIGLLATSPLRRPSLRGAAAGPHAGQAGASVWEALDGL